MSCIHVRSDYVVPGWGCCSCRSYNGYQRPVCRACGHPHCYEEGGERGREAREIAPIGSDPDLLREWLAKNVGEGVPSPDEAELVSPVVLMGRRGGLPS